jgi:hypothetical protein
MFTHGFAPMRFASFIAVCLLLATPARRGHADPVLTTDFPSPTPLSVQAGDTSTAMTLSVFDNELDGLAMTADRLTAYTVTLQIVPQLGATGTLTFATPTTSTAATEPANYLLGSVVNFGLNVTNSGSQLYAFDFDTETLGTDSDGVDVTEAGFNVLAMTFAASADASGLFNIVVVPGPTNTQWADNAMGTQGEHDFFNVPAMGGNVVVGQVSVTAVPEASSFVALGLASLAVAAGQWVRRHRAA